MIENTNAYRIISTRLNNSAKRRLLNIVFAYRLISKIIAVADNRYDKLKLIYSETDNSKV